ncbi:MAG: hypothetical protein ABW252_06280 [Polyangiales bacterium]
MTSPFVAGVPQPLHPGRANGVTAPPSQRPPPATTPARGPAANLRGTMLGVAPPVGLIPGASPPAAGPPADAPSKRTMMGVAPPLAPPPAAPPAAAPRHAMTPAREELARQAAAVLAHGGAHAAPAAPTPSPTFSPPSGFPPPSTSAFPPPPTPRSSPPASLPLPPLHGAPSAPAIPAASASPADLLRQAPPPSGRSLPAQKVAAKSDRTMLGVPAPLRGTLDGASTASGPRPPGATTSATSMSMTLGDVEAAGIRRTRRAKRGALRPLLAALAGALLVLMLGGLAWHFMRGPELGVRIVQGESGDALEISVPEAPPDAKARFAKAEQPLRAGVALFPLSADALALGDNELSIGIVRGDDVQTSQVRVHVAYRARVDTAALDREPPALDVVIEALPGSDVTLDGAKLALDARGKATRAYPIGVEGGGKLAFQARYRIALPDGAVTEGALSSSLPVASVQVDRPGANVTTDQASVDVAGVAEQGAELTVDGQAVKIADDGRFSQRVKLPGLGAHTIAVRARSPGKAPRALQLAVTRVADLAAAAAAFEADTAITYEKLAADPVALRGRKVAFEGRVYNVEVGGGASRLQMLVRACPRGQRCPLWVELSQAVDVGTDASVRVLGTVAGEQQFRSERGQVHTVPSVHAQYVLKSSR